MAASSDTRTPNDLKTLSALYGASRRIAHAPGAPQIYRALLEGACDALECSAAAIYSCDERDGERLLSLADSLPAGSSLPATLAPGELWLTLLSQSRVLPGVDPPGADPASAVAALAEGEGPRHGVASAVRGGAGLRAVAIAIWPLNAARPAGWLSALAALAEDAGYALDKAAAVQPEVLADAKDTHGLLTAVNAVTDIGLLYSSLIDRLLGAILGQILEVLGLGGGAIFLYNEQAERVDLAMTARGPEAEYGHDPGGLWEGALLTHTLAQARETARFGYPALTVYAQEAGAPGGSPLATALHAMGAVNLVSVPLLAGGWLTGVLQVVAAPGETVREGQVQVLRILARQTAVAIENARLYAQTRADQERTRAVVDATNDAILMLDELRRPMIVNRRARFFFGLTERDLLGKSLDQLGSVFGRIFEEGQRFNGWLGQLLRSQTERAVEEFSILSPEPRLLQCFSAPVMDVHDRYLGRILVFRDITREREVERMKNDFVSIVSHELRTPLTSIQGALQLVLGKPGGRDGLGAELQQQARDLLSISLANTERLIRLINDILDIAKIEQGRIQLRRETLTPEELCRSAAAAMSALANERGIIIDVQLPPRLPLVLADRDRSLQILINLLSNAVKFSPEGQLVRLSARAEGQMVCFTVQDWGRGIAPEHQSRIFQKFQQIDSSATRDVGGTGLGLAISKALVEEQGGRMWLESEPARGSTFSFTLPLAPGAELQPGQARPKAIVAEGEPSLRGDLCVALEATGWEAQPAADSAELLALLGHGGASLVVLGLPFGADASLLKGLRTLPGALDASFLLLIDRAPAELPRYSETLPRASEPAAVAARAEQLLAERRPLVLVVDDDPNVRPVLVRLLQRHGLRVSNASDGYVALAAVEKLQPDVILLDIRMPGLDGFEVLRRLSANPVSAHIPVIILTANDLSETTRAQGLELGAKAYLEKPIAYERLISTINGVLRVGEKP